MNRNASEAAASAAHPQKAGPSATSSSPARVYLVDDDPAVLKGLGRLLRSAGMTVNAYSSPQQFLDQHQADSPGCLVLDIAMPGLSGMELQRALADSGRDLPIIFLTGRGDIPTSVTAMKRGAVDFLTKPVNDADLLRAIHAALEKDRLQRQARGQITEIQQRLATLTPREHEVLRHVIAGHLNKQTAADLGTVEKTIKVHRARVMEKMKADSVAELVRLAERAGIPMA